MILLIYGHLIFFSKVTPDTPAIIYKKYQSLWYKYMSIVRDFPNGLENAGLTARCEFQSAMVEGNVSTVLGRKMTIL